MYDSNLDYELLTHLAICFLAFGMLLLSQVLEHVTPTFRNLLTVASILCSLLERGRNYSYWKLGQQHL